MSAEDGSATDGVEEGQIDHRQAAGGGSGDETSGQAVAIAGTIGGAVEVTAAAGWPRQANHQRGGALEGARDIRPRLGVARRPSGRAASAWRRTRQ